MAILQVGLMQPHVAQGVKIDTLEPSISRCQQCRLDLKVKTHPHANAHQHAHTHASLSFPRGGELRGDLPNGWRDDGDVELLWQPT